MDPGEFTRRYFNMEDDPTVEVEVNDITLDAFRDYQGVPGYAVYLTRGIAAFEKLIMTRDLDVLSEGFSFDPIDHVPVVRPGKLIISNGERKYIHPY